MTSGSNVNVVLNTQNGKYTFVKLINSRLHPITMCFQAVEKSYDLTSPPTTPMPFVYLIINIYLLFVNPKAKPVQHPHASHLAYTITKEDMATLMKIVENNITVSMEKNPKVYSVLKRYYNYYLEHVNREVETETVSSSSSSSSSSQTSVTSKSESTSSFTTSEEAKDPDGIVDDLYFKKVPPLKGDTFLKFVGDNMSKKAKTKLDRKNDMVIEFSFPGVDLKTITHDNLRAYISDKKLLEFTINGSLDKLILSDNVGFKKEYANKGIKCLNFAEDLFKEQEITTQTTEVEKSMPLWKKLTILCSVIAGFILLVILLYCCLKTRSKKKETILSLAPIGV